MKSLICSLVLILSVLVSKAQFPITSTQGSVTTLTKPLGGLQAGVGMIMTVYADTTAANLNAYLKTYNGGVIYCTSDSALYFRSNGASRWVQILPSGGTTGLNAWLITGNSGTTAGTNFLGTTDNKGLMFKVNGIQSAFLDYALGNASWGYQSMLNNSTGSNNTASGITSMLSNVSGNHNSAFGEQSLYSMTSGEKNVALGYSAGKYYISPSNKLFVDGLDRTDSAGTRNKSLIYGEFNATAASQKLYVNGQFYLPYIASGAGTKVMRVNPGTGYATYSDTTISESYLGSIYSATSWTTLGAFTNAGSTSSVVSNKIQFSGGANTYTQTLGLTPATNIEHWKMSAKVKVGTKDATSYGFGLGVRSTNTTNQSNEVGIFNMTSSGGTVSLAMGGGYTGVGNTATALTFSVNDYIILTVERNMDEFIVTATNSTTGGSLSQTYYRYSPALSTTTQPNNTGRFSVYSLGGTFTIDSLAVESYETKNALFAIEGDSKAWGYNLSAYDNRFGDLLKKSFKSTIVQGGSGDKTIDLSGRLQEVINLSPQNVLLSIGSNDIRTGVPYATYTARYDSIVTALTAAGINVYHLLTFPEGTGGVDVTPLVGYISATYPANRIIDTYNPINNARRSYIQSDSIHLNNAGNNLVYNLIFSSNLFSAGTADPYKHFNSMGSGNTGDISRFNTSTTTAVGIYNNNGLRNTLISGDAPLTTATDFEMKTGANYYLTQAGTLRLQVSAGVLSVIGDGDHTFAYGSAGEYHIKTSQTASNELTTGPWTGSTNTNTVIVPAINGTNGAKTQLGYFGSGGWMEGLSLSNNTGYATTNMLLMKSGGNVGIGTSSPTAKLHINGSVNINKDSLAITTGKKWKVMIDTASGTLVRDSTTADLSAYLPLAGGTMTGQLIQSLNGAASTPPIKATGTWFTGGSATTTKPYLLIEPTGTTSTAWNTAGTGLGINAASGFIGYLFDAQIAGVSKFTISNAGAAHTGHFSAGYYRNNNNNFHLSGANTGTGTIGALTLYDGSESGAAFLQMGGTSSSYPGISRNGTGIDIKLANNSAYTGIQSLYDRFGSGSPESVVTAPVGAVYHRTDGGAGTSFYVKESGSGNTGWVAK